ncbi:MAG: HAD-IIA family hydrolase [Chloroflexi bacterium]|nr:HAD-IIA family hydrolase [Chloroflexota bacterium]
MINQIKPIDAIILDMDGVVWRSFSPIGNIPWVFERFREIKLKYALATNNSTKTASQYVQKLAAIGVTVPESQIFTSSFAMAHLLKSRYPEGGPVFIMGEEGLRKPLADQGFFHQDENVLAVVCGLDREFSFEKLSKVTYLIRSGIDFYMTNPDRTFPTSKGLGPGAGAILAAIEAATDVQPILAGKPSPAIIQTIMHEIGSKPETTLVVGDRLDTDIMAGQAAGCLTAIVLSGVATREEVEKWQPKVDYVSEDLEHMVIELFGSEGNI